MTSTGVVVTCVRHIEVLTQGVRPAPALRVDVAVRADEAWALRLHEGEKLGYC